MGKLNILVKYGELTLKKKNAALFKNILAQNIENALSDFDCNVTTSFSRIYIVINKSDLDMIVNMLGKIYGIHSFAVYDSCENDLEIIKETALKCVENLNVETFKVETKRKNKNFETPSLEISRQVGGYILHHSDFRVDVHHPELMLKIEIRNRETLIYFNEFKGPGGLPVGVGGKSLLMLSGGIDSPVAGYLVNKRGVRFDAIHFTSPPYTAQESLDKVYDLCDVLSTYNGNFNLYVVKFTNVQENLLQLSKISYFMTLMRRIMYRIANNIANEYEYKAIVNGDSIGQVASQTLESMSTIDCVTTYPMIRPLAIYDKLETIEIAKNIGTYDISIRAFEDCCTVFVPKSPVIKPKITEALRLESQFDIEAMIEEVMNNIEIVKIKKGSKKFEELL